MKIWLKYLLLPLMLGLSGYSVAMDESQADDMADLAAVFVYLKNNCGYQDIPDEQVRNSLIFYAKQNHWQLDHSSQIMIQQRVRSSYLDLSEIPIALAQKCRALAEQSLGLLEYGQ